MKKWKPQPMQTTENPVKSGGRAHVVVYENNDVDACIPQEHEGLKLQKVSKTRAGSLFPDARKGDFAAIRRKITCWRERPSSRFERRMRQIAKWFEQRWRETVQNWCKIERAMALSSRVRVNSYRHGARQCRDFRRASPHGSVRFTTTFIHQQISRSILNVRKKNNFFLLSLTQNFRTLRLPPRRYSRSKKIKFICL